MGGEVQTLKMEIASKSAALSHREQSAGDDLAARKKKIHKYYEKMVLKNCAALHSEYQQNLTRLQTQFDERLRELTKKGDADADAKHEKDLKETMAKAKAQSETAARHEKELNEMTARFEAAQATENGFKLEIAKFQLENEELSGAVTAKSAELTQSERKHSTETAAMQRRAEAKEKEFLEMREIVCALRRQKEAMAQNKCAVPAQSKQRQFELTKNAEALTAQLNASETRNAAISGKLEKYRRSDAQIRQCALKYRGRLKGVHKFGRDLRLEIRSHKNELSFIKSSFAMFMERLFHEMGVSFNKIQAQSAKHRMKMEMKSESTEKRKSVKSEATSQSALTQCAVEMERGNGLDIDELRDEVNTIRNELDRAKIALSPKKIKFNKISAGSIDSSVTSSARQHTKSRARTSIQRPKSSRRRESFDTATISKLRTDLQSLESTYKHSKRETKRRYSFGDQYSVESSSSSGL